MKKTDSIYEEYADLIYKFLYRLTGNADLSEELTQETFYQALRTINSFNGESKMSTWLCQIAKHIWYKYLEKKAKNQHISIEDMEYEVLDENVPEKLIIKSNDRVFLYRQIHTIPEPYKEVIMLRVLGGLRFSEIADVMGKTENWSRVAFHRAKIMLIEGSKLNGNQV